MRKRNIKTVAHWVIMCFLLLFPIVLVGISAFANDEQSVTVTETYQYETNDINLTSDFVEGNIYKMVLPFGNDDFANLETSEDYYFDYIYIPFQNEQEEFLIKSSTALFSISLEYSGSNFDDACRLDVLFEDTILKTYEDLDLYLYIIIRSNFVYDGIVPFLSASDYLGEVTTNVDIQNSNYKQEVNNWANGFKNLPVNQWYGQLLNVCGVGQTTNSVMNVIYVYPLYVLWVYLIDLILDCLLVIVNLGHNVLKRVDGDIE